MTERYVVEIRNGMSTRVRSQAVLSSEVLANLRAEGPMPKRRLMTSTGSTHMLVDMVLQDLLGDGKVEKYRAKSQRGRIDEFWCIKGNAPAAKHVSCFKGDATLAALQAEARRRLQGVL
jgi:hypothetical protein